MLVLSAIGAVFLGPCYESGGNAINKTVKAVWLTGAATLITPLTPR